MTFTILDLLRAMVLFEIVVVMVFSFASMIFYIKRLRSHQNLETRLTWHVVIIAAVFVGLCIDRFLWVLSRMGAEELSIPRIFVYLILFAAACIAQYLLYGRQIKRFRQGT